MVELVVISIQLHALAPWSKLIQRSTNFCTQLEVDRASLETPGGFLMVPEPTIENQRTGSRCRTGLELSWIDVKRKTAGSFERRKASRSLLTTVTGKVCVCFFEGGFEDEMEWIWLPVEYPRCHASWRWPGTWGRKLPTDEKRTYECLFLSIVSSCSANAKSCCVESH